MRKRFGRDVAVDGITVTARAGELTTLVGPSGCGKTTTLRAIGGFLDPEEGEILIGDRVVNGVPPSRRSTRTVFQNYALFPHMSVFENVAFGLRATGARRSEIPTRVGESLEIVGLSGLERRASGELSGGQQQRVAFARALVTRPEVLLLDEPLSNLDAKLRIQMRGEIRRIQQEVGITTVYVTHDQEEAMSLSDHMVVMNQGRVEQQGLPHEVYEAPASKFVASFIGVTNFVPAEIESRTADTFRVRSLGVHMDVPRPPTVDEETSAATMVVRPEHLHVVRAGEEEAEVGSSMPRAQYLRGTVREVSYLGAAASYRVKVASGEELTVQDPAPHGADLHRVGQEVTLLLEVPRVYLLPT
ncbi:MAG: ABC transporter ATP-binding protein [Trueperaceae bacterium]|nr:ABC transporter ATP-binding protein [Trueperaceae bacterium]